MFVRCGQWLKVESSFPKLDTDLVCDAEKFAF